MIPISLTLKGIYSYREEQTIDFTRLTAAHIFGIFGPVGSGKSTILEAISFALYGETERLNSRDNRAYNMMNLKSNELLIDFIFQIGDSDLQYRALVKGKRNTRNFDKVNSFDRTAYKKNGGEWTPVEINSVPGIIGLSYDNFRRTIIIPQNQFQEFLQLGDKERTDMMKQLFHLEKYELDKNVKTLEDKNNAQLNICNDRIAQIGMVNEVQIIDAQEQLNGTQTQIQDTEKTLKEKQHAEQELKNLKDLFERALKQQQIVNTLEAADEEFQKLEKQLKDYEFCQLNFKNLLDNLHKEQQSVYKQQQEIEGHQKKLVETQSQSSSNEHEFVKIKTAYDNRGKLKSKAEELTKVISIKKLKSQESVLDAGILLGDDYIFKRKENIVKHSDELNSKKGNVIILKKQAEDVILLSSIRDWFNTKNSIQKSLEAYKKELSEYEADKRSEEANLPSLITPAIKKIIGNTPADATVLELLISIEESKKHLLKMIAEADTAIIHLNTQSKLEQYATELKPGEPCPICGSLEHPHVFNTKEASVAIKAAQANKKTLEEKIEILTLLVSNLKHSEHQINSLSKTLEKTKAKQKQEEEHLEKHLENFNWENFDPHKEEALNRAFDNAKRHKEQIILLESEIHNIEAALDKENKLYKQAEDKLNGYKRDKASKSSAITTLQSQLKTLDYANYKLQTEAILEKEMESLEREYELIEKDYSRLDKLVSDLKGKENQLKGSLETEKKGFEAANKNLTDLENEFNEKLKSSSYKSRENIEAILKSSFEIDNERKKITDHRLHLNTARLQHKALQEQIGIRKYDEHKHLTLLAELRDLQQKMHQLIGERASLADKIKGLKNDLEKLAKLQKEVEVLNLRKSDINVFKSLFKAGGFVNYISSVYLQNLCNAANERFYQLTSHKLKLQLNINNNFEVIDFMNNGQVRNVKTLSGGQTFQAALSLALALADNIQKLTQSKQNFFFLDEGFGALDRESLQIVFNTLQTLRKENRIVGVISHVEDMQQEIDTYLSVTNNEERGSIVKASWEN